MIYLARIVALFALVWFVLAVAVYRALTAVAEKNQTARVLITAGQHHPCRRCKTACTQW